MDLLYEAAVGGGIPAIKCLLHHVVSQGIREVSGILNGTSNYILTKMAVEGADYDEALREAQAKGYAEADPTNDVEGFDALYKAILQRIAFGRAAGNEARQGISSLLPVDFEYAKALGCTIKLRCSATPTTVSVMPTVISRALPLGSVDGVLNAVTIDHNIMGTVTLTGPGAGRRDRPQHRLGRPAAPQHPPTVRGRRAEGRRARPLVLHLLPAPRRARPSRDHLRGRGRLRGPGSQHRRRPPEPGVPRLRLFLGCPPVRGPPPRDRQQENGRPLRGPAPKGLVRRGPAGMPLLR